MRDGGPVRASPHDRAGPRCDGIPFGSRGPALSGCRPARPRGYPGQLDGLLRLSGVRTTPPPVRSRCQCPGFDLQHRAACHRIHEKRNTRMSRLPEVLTEILMSDVSDLPPSTPLTAL